MKPEIKKLWLEALRSGEYAQGTRVLRTDSEQYCCLGVLTDLYLKANNKPWTRVNDQYGIGVEAQDIGGGEELEEYFEYQDLPQPIQTWAGLTSPNPWVNENSLTYWNDTSIPFTEIADLIEKHL